MSSKRRKQSQPDAGAKAPREDTTPRIPEPVNVADGVPDRAKTPSRRRLVAVIVVFAAWCAFLVYCLLAGGG